MEDLKQTPAMDQFSLTGKIGGWTLRRLGCERVERRFSGTKVEAVKDSVEYVLGQFVFAQTPLS